MNIFVFVFVFNIAKVLWEITITKLEKNKIIKKQDWFSFLQVVWIYCCVFLSNLYTAHSNLPWELEQKLSCGGEHFICKTVAVQLYDSGNFHFYLCQLQSDRVMCSLRIFVLGQIIYSLPQYRKSNLGLGVICLLNFILHEWVFCLHVCMYVRHICTWCLLRSEVTDRDYHMDTGNQPPLLSKSNKCS